MKPGPVSLFHPRPRMRLAVWLLVILLLDVTLAHAHAVLRASEPSDGSMLQAPPASLALIFSEPVTPLALRLAGPDGNVRELDRFDVRKDRVEIEVLGELDQGTHVLSWRVVSADGHPVGGSLIFSIGAPTGVKSGLPDQADPAVRVGLWIARVMLLSGMFIGVGGVLARHMLLPHERAGSRILATALLLGAAGALASLGLQGLDALGVSFSHLSDPAVWQAALGTSLGMTVKTALLSFLLAAAALTLQGAMGKVTAFGAWLICGLALALSGHASAASPQWLMRPAVFLHVLGVGAWIGALVPLALALRRDLPGTSEALRRFSRLIPIPIAILALAGLVLAMVQLRQPQALASTDYGRLLLAKLALLVGIFVLAGVNRWRLTAPAMAGNSGARRLLAGAIFAEILLALLVLGIVAGWRFTPPPRALAVAGTAPVVRHIHTANGMADLTIMPGRAGTVSVSAMLLTGEFETLEAKEVSFLFARPRAGIEPFRREASRDADGEWRVGNVQLPLPGLWNVRIDVLVSDFEILKLEGQFELAR